MDKLLSELTETSNSSLFIYVIVSFMVLLFLFRAALGYRHYKGSIFTKIYDNYLIDYYYKLNVLQDASKSALLKKLIGYHRIVYANITNKEGRLASQILTIIHSKGVLAIAYLNAIGSFHGSDNGSWYIKRTEDNQEKKFKIENPAIYLREYNTHLSQILEGKRTQSVIALREEADISNIKSNFRVVKYSELEDIIKEADCGYGLNETEIDDIFVKLGGKITR